MISQYPPTLPRSWLSYLAVIEVFTSYRENSTLWSVFTANFAAEFCPMHANSFCFCMDPSTYTFTRLLYWSKMNTGSGELRVTRGSLTPWSPLHLVSVLRQTGFLSWGGDGRDGAPGCTDRLLMIMKTFRGRDSHICAGPFVRLFRFDHWFCPRLFISGEVAPSRYYHLHNIERMSEEGVSRFSPSLASAPLIDTLPW